MKVKDSDESFRDSPLDSHAVIGDSLGISYNFCICFPYPPSQYSRKYLKSNEIQDRMVSPDSTLLSIQTRASLNLPILDTFPYSLWRLESMTEMQGEERGNSKVKDSLMITCLLSGNPSKKQDLRSRPLNSCSQV